MAKKKAVKAGGKKSGLKRRLIATGLVLLVLYIGVQVISRTDGIRALVADKISNGTRLPVTLEKCGATPFLGLRLQGLAIQGAAMPDVKMSFNWFSVFSKEKPLVKKLWLKDPKIRFRREPKTGNWEPLVLDGVGRRLGAVVGLNPVDMPQNNSTPKFPSYVINKNTRLRLSGANVVWQDEQEHQLASIDDGNFRIKVGRFTKRKVMQIIATCGKIKLASGHELDNFRLEAFRIEGSDWTTVLDMSDSTGQYPQFASSTLWQDLNLHLSKLSDVK